MIRFFINRFFCSMERNNKLYFMVRQNQILTAMSNSDCYRSKELGIFSLTITHWWSRVNGCYFLTLG